MEVKLSIIMPCYNCEETVEEAARSLYDQNLTVPFEVIMVDDASEDNTRNILAKIANLYPKARFYYHNKNQGGGATRNTAVCQAEGSLIFCLDSDDVLPPNTLPKMVGYLEKNRLDGVGIEKSIKFRGRNISDIAYINTFQFSGQSIPFESLFDGFYCSLNCPTFLYTRKAFEIAGGYPTDLGGLDTQGFAFRFLANGLVAHTCPETGYLHRIKFHRSYYIREYEEGKISHNLFKIYEEFFYLFNEEAKEQMLNHDLNDYENPLSALFADQTWQFKKNYRSFLVHHSKDLYREFIKKTSAPTKFDHYWLGTEAYRSGDYSKAAQEFLCATLKGMRCDRAYAKAFHALCAVNNLKYLDVHEQIRRLYTYKRKGSLQPFYMRVFEQLSKECKTRILGRRVKAIGSY
jgi:glycosyltransferase involved in cell wall biosynthesis